MRLPEGGEEARLAGLRAADLDGAAAAPDPVWRALAEHARLAFDAPVAGVSLVGRETSVWLALVGAALPAETPRALSPCDRVVAGHDALALDLSDEAEGLAAGPLAAAGLRGYLAAPVRLPGGPRIGAAAVMFRAPRRFLGPERALIESLAALAGALAARRGAPPRDKTTGALTEPAFRAALAEAAAGALAARAPASVLLIEPEGLDDLRLGAGDAAAEARLGALARRLALRARERDVAGRLGRNLLGLLLPDTLPEEGVAAAHRLSLALAEEGESAARLRVGAAPLAPPEAARLRIEVLGDGAPDAAATLALERAHAALRLARAAAPGAVATPEGVARRPPPPTRTMRRTA